MPGTSANAWRAARQSTTTAPRRLLRSHSIGSPKSRRVVSVSLAWSIHSRPRTVAMPSRVRVARVCRPVATRSSKAPSRNRDRSWPVYRQRPARSGARRSLQRTIRSLQSAGHSPEVRQPILGGSSFCERPSIREKAESWPKTRARHQCQQNRLGKLATPEAFDH